MSTYNEALTRASAYARAQRKANGLIRVAFHKLREALRPSGWLLLQEPPRIGDRPPHETGRSLVSFT